MPIFEKSSGFTLIELLVVISIMAILSGFVMVNFIGSREEGNVKAQISKLQSLLEQVQTNAASSVLCGLPPQGGASWMVRINPAAGQFNMFCQVGELPAVIPSPDKSFVVNPSLSSTVVFCTQEGDISQTPFSITYPPLSNRPSFSDVSCQNGLTIRIKSIKDSTVYHDLRVSPGGSLNVK